MKPIYRWMIYCAGALLIILVMPPALGVETLEMNRALQSGASTTSSPTFSNAFSINNAATNTGDVLVVASFSADPQSGGGGAKRGEWQLTSGAQTSQPIERDISDSSNDFGAINLVHIFSNLGGTDTINLQHRSQTSNGIRTSQITLITIPLTTDGSITLNHDQASQGTATFTTSSTTAVPVTGLTATVTVDAVNAPKAIFFAAVMTTRSGAGTAAEDAFWQIQFKEQGAATWTAAGTEIERTLSGASDVGAVTLYAMAEGVNAGTYDVRLVTRSLSGNAIVTEDATLAAVSLSFPGAGGGYFPYLQDTVASAQTSSNSSAPMSGLSETFVLDSTADVFLAMSLDARTTQSGSGNVGEFETCIPGSFGQNNNGDSQEVSRTFATAITDFGAAGAVGLAQNLTAGTYTAQGCWNITGNTMETTDPNLVGFVGTSVEATQALIGDFRVIQWNGQTVVSWITLTEIGTMSFDLLRRDAATGRWKTVNTEPLPAVGVAQGGVYRYADPAAGPGATLTYLLVEHEIGSQGRQHGPFTVQVNARTKPRALSQTRTNLGGTDRFSAEPHPPTPTTSEKLALRQQEQFRLAKASSSNKGKQAKRLKITVTQPGLISLSAQDLAAIGNRSLSAVTRAIKKGRLTLSNRGAMVAWTPTTDNAGVLFYGESIDSLHTAENVYWLEWKSGQTMPTTSGGDPAPTTTTAAFLERLYFEEDSFAATGWVKDPNTDYWFWKAFVAGSATYGKAVITLNADGVIDDPTRQATLQVDLYGLSETHPGQDHHLQVWLDDTLVGDVHWDGVGPQTLNLDFASSLLMDGANQFEFRALLDNGIPYSWYYLDAVELAYQRRYEAVDNRLQLRGDTNSVVTINGFQDPEVYVFDIDNPYAPRRLKVDTTPVGSGYQVSFQPSTPDTEYLALTADAFTKPAAITAQQPSNLRKGRRGVDYLIITPSEWVSTAQRLADHRARQGLKARVIALEDIFDAFNHGIQDPAAVRAFLAHAYARWRPVPRYVVLGGRGTVDPRNLTDFDDNRVITNIIATPHGLLPSDVPFVDLKGNDGLPELAIGRLPAVTQADFESVIDKLIAYEGRHQAKRIVLVADNPDQAGDFTALSETLVDAIPPDYDIDRTYLEDLPFEKAQSQLVGDFREGALVLHYTGHGSGYGFAAEQLFTTDDVPLLDNGDRLPLVTSATCLINRFELPGIPSLGEALVLHPEGGAVASWSPTGLGYTGQALLLSDTLLRKLLTSTSQPRIGDAILTTLADYQKRGALPYLLQVYNLLGDPATLMSR